MALFNIQNVLDELQNASPDVKQKAAQMIQQYGGDMPSAAMAPPSDPLHPVNDPLQKYGQNAPNAAPQADITPSNAPTPYRPAFNAFPRQSSTNTQPTSLDDRVMGLERQYSDALQAPPEKSKWWKNVGIIAAQVASNIANPNHQVKIQNWGAQKKQNRVQQILSQLGPLEQLQQSNQDRSQKYEEWRNKQALIKAQTENYGADNAFNADRLRQQQDEGIAKRQSTARSELFKGKIYDPGNMAHRGRAQDAGYDPDKMGAWDFSNPAKATINGETFVYDRVDGSWQPSGLPASEKDKLTEFSVTVPGEKNPRVFKVPQDKAASLSASLAAAGMQIEAANTRAAARLKLDEAKFSQSKQEFEKAHSLREQAQRSLDDARAKGDTIATQRLELNLRQQDDTLQKMREALIQHQDDMSEDQFKELMQFYQPKAPPLNPQGGVIKP